MADVAAEAKQIFVVNFPECALAFRTSELGDFAEPFNAGDKLATIHLLPGDFGFELDFFSQRITSSSSATRCLRQFVSKGPISRSGTE